MKARYQSRFKRDSKPTTELLFFVLEYGVLFGDLISDLIRDRLVDEIRFNPEYIAFVRNSEIFKYDYRDVETLIKYSRPVFGIGGPQVEIEFTAADGEVFHTFLNGKDNHFLSANFSSDQRDFLYQITRKMIRIQERKVNNFGILTYLLLSGFIALLLI